MMMVQGPVITTRIYMMTLNGYMLVLKNLTICHLRPKTSFLPPPGRKWNGSGFSQPRASSGPQWVVPAGPKRPSLRLWRPGPHARARSRGGSGVPSARAQRWTGKRPAPSALHAPGVREAGGSQGPILRPRFSDAGLTVGQLLRIPPSRPLRASLPGDSVCLGPPSPCM